MLSSSKPFCEQEQAVPPSMVAYGLHSHTRVLHLISPNPSPYTYTAALEKCRLPLKMLACQPGAQNTFPGAVRWHLRYSGLENQAEAFKSPSQPLQAILGRRLKSKIPSSRLEKKPASQICVSYSRKQDRAAQRSSALLTALLLKARSQKCCDPDAPCYILTPPSFLIFRGPGPFSLSSPWCS